MKTTIERQLKEEEEKKNKQPIETPNFRKRNQALQTDSAYAGRPQLKKKYIQKANYTFPANWSKTRI